MTEISAPFVDHFKNPRRVGELEAADNSARGRAGSAEEGILIQIDLQIEGGRICDARFKAYGPGAAIACGSWVAEWALGRDLEDAKRLNDRHIAQALRLPGVEVRTAVAAQTAFHAAIKRWQEQ